MIASAMGASGVNDAVSDCGFCEDLFGRAFFAATAMPEAEEHCSGTTAANMLSPSAVAVAVVIFLCVRNCRSSPHSAFHEAADHGVWLDVVAELPAATDAADVSGSLSEESNPGSCDKHSSEGGSTARGFGSMISEEAAAATLGCGSVAGKLFCAICSK